MANARFFKKFQPETPVVLANGLQIKFSTNDHLLGWYATDQEYVHQEFERCMREGRFAISEVPWEEFDREYVKKKGQSSGLKPLSREELSGTRRLVSNPVETLGAEEVRRVVGVNTEPKGVTMAEASQAPERSAPLSTPTKPDDFKPPVGRRSKRVAP